MKQGSRALPSWRLSLKYARPERPGCGLIASDPAREERSGRRSGMVERG
jgi:hypothetical protein